ncbi:hypothetical protein [Micromonospora sp. KC723]|uniref:hypothetical protein n=1 Tax=Micromonospora sp. KC723 TaxID=2530381 RepID=UPI0010431C71|nr:hypothetical protein [Micromonospora sp. KC723]TDB76292.1 hypothetical protein E1165_07865 [Micromonospora sp. KC723]
MSSYTITIAADDPGQATTTVRVQWNGATARITELLVRAGEGDGLTASQLPAVDLDLLLTAVTPAVGGQQALTVSPAAPADESPAGVSVDEEPGADTDVDQPAAVTTSTADQPATATQVRNEPTDAAVPRQASRAKARATGVARAGGRKAAAGGKATTSGRKATKQTGKSEASPGTGRVYRRSPDDLESVYQQAGSVAAVADHYNVPRHTAQGWIRTLRRRQGSPAE